MIGGIGGRRDAVDDAAIPVLDIVDLPVLVELQAGIQRARIVDRIGQARYRDRVHRPAGTVENEVLLGGAQRQCIVERAVIADDIFLARQIHHADRTAWIDDQSIGAGTVGHDRRRAEGSVLDEGEIRAARRGDRVVHAAIDGYDDIGNVREAHAATEAARYLDGNRGDGWWGGKVERTRGARTDHVGRAARHAGAQAGTLMPRSAAGARLGSSRPPRTGHRLASLRLRDKDGFSNTPGANKPLAPPRR